MISGRCAALAVEKLHNEFAEYRPIKRLAMLVVHSNPLAEPGAGDAGGMTVYVRQVAKSLAGYGIEVDIYTRRDSINTPSESELYPGVRVIQIEAGRPGIAKEQIPAHLPAFTSNLVRSIDLRFPGTHSYDMIHSHYWLSGKVASLLKARTGTPFIHTFHTLGRVKNHAKRNGDAPEPESRLHGEAKVIAEACAIVASTSEERRSLIELYAAHPERINLIPPGVDHSLFKPGNRAVAKRRLGLENHKVLLFVGRLQPLKSADTAVRALAHLAGSGRANSAALRMLIVGGSSGASGAGELDRLHRLAEDLGVAGTTEFIPAQPQTELPALYQAADVCLVPSRAESFGLVALEAQACGVPVVGSSVGGLRSIIQHGQTGFLADPGSSRSFADHAWTILSDDHLAACMGASGVSASERFSWDRSADELHQLYSANSGKLDCGSFASNFSRP